MIGIALVVAAAMVIAWFAPPLLNPRLASGEHWFWSSGVFAMMPGSSFALAGMEAPSTQSVVTIAGVNDISGASVAGVWITRPDQDDAMLSAWDIVSKRVCPDQENCHPQPGVGSDLGEFMMAWQEAGAPIQGNDLPRKLQQGQSLWILWEITDCSLAYTNVDVDPLEGVRIRGLFGITVIQRVNIPSPFDYGIEELEELGSCPV